MKRIRMQDSSEQLYTIHQSRAWAAEVRRRIDDVHIQPLFASPPPCVTGWSDASKLVDCALDGVTARHDKDHIRTSSFHGVPGRFMRCGIPRSKDIATTGQLDHFRNPVACDIERIQPLKTHHSGMRVPPTRLCAHVVHSTTELLSERPSLCEYACRFGDALDILNHVIQRRRAECEDVGSMVK
jgi:hypothetical protein